MAEYVAMLVLVAVMLFQAWIFRDQREAYEKRVQNLLDRLMAADYAQFVQGEVAKKHAERPLTPEEIAAMNEERGIPV